MMKRQAILVLAMVVLCSAVSANVGAVVVFDDGGTYDIDYEINDDISADYQAPGMQTTVNWLDGASTNHLLDAYENSNVNVSGGIIGGWLTAHDSSQIHISGGTLNNFLRIYDSSRVYISDGVLNQSSFGSGYVTVYDNSQFTISGGSINGDLHVGNSSQAIVSGGTIGEDISTVLDGQVTISGGSIRGGLQANHNSQITIEGTDFTIDSFGVSYGEIFPTSGTLGGILASGDPINNYFEIRDSASIVLTPEPTTLLLLGLGSLALVRKRRTL